MKTKISVIFFCLLSLSSHAFDFKIETSWESRDSYQGSARLGLSPLFWLFSSKGVVKFQQDSPGIYQPKLGWRNGGDRRPHQMAIEELYISLHLGPLSLTSGKLVDRSLEQTFEINPGSVINPQDFTNLFEPDQIGVWGGRATLDLFGQTIGVIVNEFTPVRLPNPRGPWYPLPLERINNLHRFTPKGTTAFNKTAYLQNEIGYLSHWTVAHRGFRPYATIGPAGLFFEKQTLLASLGSLSLPLDVTTRWEIAWPQPEQAPQYLTGVVSLERAWFIGNWEVITITQGSYVYSDNDSGQDPLNWHRLFDRHLMGQVSAASDDLEFEIRGIINPGQEWYTHLLAIKHSGNLYLSAKTTVVGGKTDSFFGGLKNDKSVKLTVGYAH